MHALSWWINGLSRRDAASPSCCDVSSCSQRRAESFKVFSGVRQGGVLSPYLFTSNINDLTDDVRNSSVGIYIGTVFVGCIFDADDILLLSAGSCTGLQQMVNVCARCGLL